MGFYTTLETVPIYSNNAYTIQCTLTFSNTAALLFKESTEHGVVEFERNTLVTPFHANLERHLDLVVWFAHWGFGVGVFFFLSYFWHLSWWNSVWKITYRERRKTIVPSRLTTTARVLQERMKYPNKAYWAIPTAKNKPPIDPNIQLKNKTLWHL